MSYDGSSGGALLCSSCGYDNPREHRYCGMCGTPFPHRPLTVPEAQSTLTFTSAPIEVAPSAIAVPQADIPAPAPLEAEPVEPPPPFSHSRSDVWEEVAAPIPEIVAPEAAAATVELPAAQPVPIVEAAPPAPPSDEPVYEVPEPEPIQVHEQSVPVLHSESPPPAEDLQVVASAAAEPDVQSLAPPIHVVEQPSAPLHAVESEPESPAVPSDAPTPPPDDIRRWTPHIVPRSTPRPAHTDAAPRTPAVIHPSPDSLPMTPPPASAGMPTFQSVAEASGAPAISPFEPQAEKHPDEERELQEFVASFRYNPPAESVDELTMRSEVPVLDAEAPVAPSHPSFDDDVPPPPEAGPHPTGQEYYSSGNAPSDRARFLEIEDSPRKAASASGPATASGTSLLGLSGPSATTMPSPDDEVARPSGTRWLLWTSVALLVALFGSLGFLEGRAGMDHAYTGSVAIIKEQYSKLRQRVSELTAPKPAAPTESPAAQPLSEVKPTSPEQSAAKPAAESASNSTPASALATQPAATADQQPSKSPDTSQQSAPATDTSTTPPASVPQPAVATQKPAAEAPASPAPDTTAAKHDLASEPPLVTVKPKSKPDPGQQELANALQANDPAAAAAWLWKATSRGNSVAPVRLADMYLKGKGVPRSCEQALVLLRSEAAKDNAPARNRLASLYANGTCVARDRVRAYQLMSSALAVDPTSEWAEQNRKELWQQMTPEERAQAEKYR
jgi:hypothetical protein